MTPTQLIAAVRAWSAHVITQPDDPMRVYVDAVLAMAEYTSNIHSTYPDFDMAIEQHEKMIRALLAAGAEVEHG